MENHVHQWTISNLQTDDHLSTQIESFLIDRKAQNMAAGTLYFYRAKLALFAHFCDTQLITRITDITPDTLRRYLLHLSDTGHNAGGIHAAYRSVKTFMFWWEDETEPVGWSNPIRKVKPPRLPVEPLEPVELDTVQKMIDTCKGDTFVSLRDKAIMLVLLDTGLRAFELLAVNLDDIDLPNGSILIRAGKGRKPRYVYIQQKARRALRAYLKKPADTLPAVWVTDDALTRLTYWGLNEMIERRANAAMVEKPTLHDFRRAFAINALRNGMDIYSLQKLMGHADLQVLRRYLSQTNDDLRAAHQKASPANRLR